MAKWSDLTNDEAKHFGHYVYNIMNRREWDADSLDAIAVVAADVIGKPFADLEED